MHGEHNKPTTATANPTRAARAKAHANIALAKYWGKLDPEENLPAVPSVSITLEALSTITTVAFDPSLQEDTLTLNGAPCGGQALDRVGRLLDRVRSMAGTTTSARVTSQNDFPTASGLASSASAFAALALAATQAAALAIDRSEVSDIARRASASAARSVFGGFVGLAAGAPGETFLAASPIASRDHWNLNVVVAITSDRAKPIGSTGAMRHTADTSPYYRAWLDLCPRLVERIHKAIEARDLHALGEAAEHSALAMHACALAATPAILYFEPATIGAIRCIQSLRKRGVVVYATIDAGPHVKAITALENSQVVAHALGEVPGVLRTIVSAIGGDATVEPVGGST